MKNTQKQLYVAPLTEVIRVVQEGVICGSTQNTASRQDYDWEEW